MRIAGFQIPEIVQVAVGEDNEAAILGTGVLAGLLFSDQGLFLLRLGLENNKREAFFVQKQEVNESFRYLLEIVAEGIDIGGSDGDAGFQTDVGGPCLRQGKNANRSPQAIGLSLFVQ